MPLRYSRTTVSNAISGLSPEISHLTCNPAYAPFTPSKSGQRLPPTYYRGCWHVVSRGLFSRYRHYRPSSKKFTTRKPSSFTRRCWVRVAPIAQYSPLLPPVGVWAVSQSQCGHQLSNQTRAHPSAIKSLVSRRCLQDTLCGISSSFPLLSPSEGQVAHVLLTRPPLTWGASSPRPFDLHVLGTPPAFVLSQDQTLK